MGAIGGLIGVGGGASGTGIAGPQQANITAPTNSQQVGQAYTGTQNALNSQNALLSALQGQNGLGNQSQVYGQLQGIASGAVNPAQAQFAQNTNQNVANQAALMAGQRGANQNVGLIARQAAQQGAATQQQAVGQEAAQQATNQINAIGAAGNLATTMAGQQIGQTNANTQAQQSEQSNLLNALQGYNTNQVASQASVNKANAGLAQTQMQGQQGLIGGVLNGAGAVAGAAQGGEIRRMADGGDAAPFSGSSNPASGSSGPTSKFGQFIKGAVGTGQQSQGGNNNQIPTTGPGALQQGMSSAIQGFAKRIKGAPAAPASAGPVAGGPVASMAPAAVSAAPAGSALSLATLGAAHGGMANDFRAGGKVKADSANEKAVAKGNNYSNDKIPAVLSEHEIVLPRSVTLSKDPVRESAKFVAKVIAKRKGKK